MCTRMTEEIHTLEPIFDETSRVLILGSFPSVVSRRKRKYYGNPGNRFWPVLEEIFKDRAEDIVLFCRTHHLAMWDVVSTCLIEGSSDSSIQVKEVNDLNRILSRADIQLIVLTGKKAGALFEQYFQSSIPHVILPSTSGANARVGKVELIRAYQVIKEYAEKEN